MALLLHYTGQDYISRGLLKTELIPGSTSAIVGGCKTGKGFAFDGTVDSSLSLSNLEEDDSHTLSFWINFQANPSAAQVIAIHGQAQYRQFYIYIRTTNHIVISRDSSAGTLQAIPSSSANLLTPNTWHHITYTYKNLIGTLYVNGVFAAQITYSSIVSGSDKVMQIGKFGVNALQGSICNFKYYDHVLSQKEINEDYKSLILHYKLDKPITTQVFDYSGFNRHITNLTSNTVTLDSNSQVYSASLKNDGTQSLVGTCDLTDLNGLDEGSFSFRAFLTANNLSDQYVIYNMTAVISGNGISFLFRNGVVVAYFYGTRIQFNYTPTVDAWHHVVLVKTSNQIKVYVDSVNVYTASAATSSKNFSNITSISSHPNGSNPISEGNIQDIRFYAKALTQEDVTELYQTRQEIDNLANGYCYELVEGQSEVEMKENGELWCDEVIENDDGTFSIEQNKTIKTKEIKEI